MKLKITVSGHLISKEIVEIRQCSEGNCFFHLQKSSLNNIYFRRISRPLPSCTLSYAQWELMSASKKNLICTDSSRYASGNILYAYIYIYKGQLLPLLILLLPLDESKWLKVSLRVSIRVVPPKGTIYMIGKQFRVTCRWGGRRALVLTEFFFIAKEKVVYKFLRKCFHVNTTVRMKVFSISEYLLSSKPTDYLPVMLRSYLQIVNPCFSIFEPWLIMTNKQGWQISDFQPRCLCTATQQPPHK